MTEAIEKATDPKLQRHLKVVSRTKFYLVGGALFVAAMAGPFTPLSGIGFIALIVFIIVMFVRLMKFNREWGITLMDAEAHLKAHELEEAHVRFTEMAGKFRWLQTPQVICAHYLGVIARLRGQLSLAEAINTELLDSGWLHALKGNLAFLSPSVHAEAGLVQALTGDLEAAGRLLEAARIRLSDVRKPVIALPEAVVRARRELWAECVEAIEKHRDRARGLMRPDDTRALALVEALALSRLAKLGYREGARERRPDQAIAEAKPARPGEFDYLGQQWPEMAELLQARVYAEPPG